MEPGFERRFAVLVSRLTINLAARNLREGAPIGALLNGGHRVFQKLLMSRKQRIRHSDFSVGTSSRSSDEFGTGRRRCLGWAGRRRYALARPRLSAFQRPKAGRDVGLAKSGAHP